MSIGVFKYIRKLKFNLEGNIGNNLSLDLI